MYKSRIMSNHEKISKLAYYFHEKNNERSAIDNWLLAEKCFTPILPREIEDYIKDMNYRVEKNNNKKQYDKVVKKFNCLINEINTTLSEEVEGLTTIEKIFEISRTHYFEYDYFLLNKKDYPVDEEYGDWAYQWMVMIMRYVRKDLAYLYRPLINNHVLDILQSQLDDEELEGEATVEDEHAFSNIYKDYIIAYLDFVWWDKDQKTEEITCEWCEGDIINPYADMKCLCYDHIPCGYERNRYHFKKCI